MEISEIVQAIETLHIDARERGVFFQSIQDARLSERGVTVHGKQLVSFGSCSYLGLELHPAMIQGVKDAVDRFGTQFSCSRGYLSVPLYDEIDELFLRIFDGHTFLAPSTTLAHLAAFDALMSEKDAIVMDHQVHQSVQQAANVARTRGTHVELVKHESLELAIDRVRELSRKYKTVWFTTDGIASMYGDMAPFGIIDKLLDVAENVRLYIDDAHGMSWMGRHGRGCFLHHRPLNSRTIIATSLAKAFGAGGGVLVFSDPAERERVRMCGGPAIFSGPIQPPMLGAILAGCKIHLGAELEPLQEQLKSRVRLANRALREAGLPLLVENDVPIRFLRLGLPRAAAEVAQRMAADGFYVNISMFPTVPMRRAGIRIAINAVHTDAQILALVEALSRHMHAVMRDEGLTLEHLDSLFSKTVVSDRLPDDVYAPSRNVLQFTGRVTPVGSTPVAASEANARPHGLRVETTRSIRALDRNEWDRLTVDAPACSYDSIVAVESVFAGHQARPEHRWAFDYVVVRDAAGRPVAATQLTTALHKDDMLMRPEVSKEIEEIRKQEPYFLTSKVVMTSSTCSEGNPIFLDRNGPWRQALGLLIEAIHAVYDREQADVIVLRDLPADDAALDRELVNLGFVGVPNLPRHELAIDWADEHELMHRLSRRKRKYFAEQLDHMHRFEIKTLRGGPEAVESLRADELAYLHRLYMNVAERKFRINVFALPEDFVAGFLSSPAWEIVTLHLRPEFGGPKAGRPVAWYAANLRDTTYSVFLCGLDYDYVLEHGAYRQLLLHMVRNAKLAGKRLLNVGMDADMEKSRFGTTAVPTKIYTQAREHYQSAVMRELVARLGVQEKKAA